MPSTQRPWWHGSGEQSSTLRSHSMPSKPAGPRVSGSAHLPGACPQVRPWTNPGSALSEALPIKLSGGRLNTGPAPTPTYFHSTPLQAPEFVPSQYSPTVKSHPQLWPHLQPCFCPTPHWRWEQMAGARGRYWALPIQLHTPCAQPNPLAPHVALCQSICIIGSTPQLCHWVLPCYNPAPKPSPSLLLALSPTTPAS